MGVQYTFFACLLISCVRFAFVLKRMTNDLENGGVGEEDASDVNTGNALLSWLIGPNPFQTVGPIMFNFAFIVTAPPLSAMPKRQDIASRALSMSCVVMGALYVMIGWVGAPISNAVRNGLIAGGDDTNLMSLILLSGGSAGVPSALDLLCIGTFGISTIASVPVYCLLAQETLVNDAGVAKLPAFLLSNVLPWILVALTYNASFFEAFVNWSGLLILGYANFSLPLLLDMRLKNVRTYRSMHHKSTEVCNGESPSKRRTNNRASGYDTNRVTSMVFSLVTASISAVIVMSIADSLILAGVVFVFVMLATIMWPSASMVL